jgi:hypothetical protein
VSQGTIGVGQIDVVIHQRRTGPASTAASGIVRACGALIVAGTFPHLLETHAQIPYILEAAAP